MNLDNIMEENIEEKWKDITGYEGKYQVSDCGRVRDLINDKILNQYERKSGDMSVTLYLNNTQKNFGVHQLTASHFIPNPNKRKEVLRIDKDRKNNRVSNLKWVLHNDFKGNANIDKNKQAIEDKEKLKERYTINLENITINDLVEEWKPIEGYEELYEISNSGDVRNKNTYKILAKTVVGGYYTVGLRNKNNQETVRINTLVAKHFIKNDNPETSTNVDHIDNNRLNNRVDNLRWVTQSDNIHSYNVNYKKTKFKKISQYDLEDNLIKEWNSTVEIINTYPEYSKGTILQVCSSYGKSAYGYRWKYKEDIKEIKLETDEEFKNVGTQKGRDFSRYECSNYGKVRRVGSNKILKPNTSGDYDSIMIYDNDSKEYRFQVHILVAKIFVEDVKDKEIVNHIDENKRNNYYKNLEVITYRGNAEHSFAKAVLMIDPITNETIKEFKSIRTACEYLNKGKNSGGSISVCCNNGNQKTAFRYKWKFKE